MATVAPIAGRYDLRDLLLDDGVKQSWTAYDRQLDRDVSVELVTSLDQELQRRFLARARLLAAENHPHLVTVYDTGQQGDAPYAVLEPQMQGTLAERLQEGPPFGLTQVVELGIALSVATAAALQRDLDVEPLEPTDVLLRDGDHVKLANLLLRPATLPEAVVTSEQPLVTQIAALLVAAMQPPGVGVLPITRAADLPPSLPATLRTIVLAAIATRGASIRTLAELRQALTEYRGTALSTTRAFAPLTAAHPAEALGAALVGAAAMPATRTMPIGGRRGGPVVATGRVRHQRSPWLSILGLLVVLLLVGGAVAFAEWLGSVDTVATTVPNVSASGAATPEPRAVGFPAIFSRPSPTPTSDATTPTASPTVSVVTQGQLGGNLETPTVGGAHATETAMAMASVTAGAIATETTTAGPSATPTPSTPTATPTALTTDTPVPTDTPTVTDTPVPPTATPIPTAAVPSVIGQQLADAVQVLNQAGFITARAPNRASTGVPAGAVLAQDPPATSIVPVGSSIRLTVSSGPPASTVPNVVGVPSGQAQAAIAQVGLTTNITRSPSATVPEGAVIAQNPAPGTTMQPGSQVVLTVSAGNKVTVPGVIGVPEAQAQAAIQAAGLTTTFPNRSGHSPNVQVGQVESQDPRAGTLVAPGTVVYINVRAS